MKAKPIIFAVRYAKQILKRTRSNTHRNQTENLIKAMAVKIDRGDFIWQKRVIGM